MKKIFFATIVLILNISACPPDEPRKPYLVPEANDKPLSKSYNAKDTLSKNGIIYDAKTNQPINGSIKAGPLELIYQNGLAVLLKDYYETGLLRSETPLKNKKVDGIQKFYYEDGRLEKEVHFKDGEIIVNYL